MTEILTLNEYSVPSKKDNLPLSVLTITPVSSPKAIFQLSHGMAEHKERFIPMMKFLAKQGFACIIHDHRGHGGSVKSDKDLGYLYENGSSNIVEDVHQISLFAKDLWKDIPLFLYGHSMGSLVVRCYLQKYQKDLAGLIVCGSPSANPAASFGLALCRFLKACKGDHYRSPFITNLAFGPYEKRFKETTVNCWLSKDKENVTAYNADPLCGFMFTLNGYEGLFSLLQKTYDKKIWAKIKESADTGIKDFPILFIAGSEDPCITNEKAFQKAIHTLKDAGFHNITHKLYMGYRHEIHNEDCKEEVFSDICSFLSKNLSV